MGQRAIACNGLQQPWQFWHPEQCGICKLYVRRDHRGFESHPHRQKTKDFARFEHVRTSGCFGLRANARVIFGSSLLSSPVAS